MYCPNCGYRCDRRYRFCVRCGAALPWDLEAPVPAVTDEPVLEGDPVVEPIPENAASVSEEAPSIEPAPEDAALLLEETPVREPVPEEQKPDAAEEPPAPEQADGDMPDWSTRLAVIATAPAAAQEAAPAAFAPTPPAAPKKGRLWPPLLILAIMASVGLLVFFIGSAGSSAQPWFSVEDGVLLFDASQYTGGDTLTVPRTVNGQTVTALGEGCFAYCRGLVTVELPDTLTEVGDNAFYRCEDLRGIQLPDGLRRIGQGAFSYCYALEAVVVPGSVEEIGEFAFGGCPELVHIFYTGTYRDWRALYSESITPYTYIYCVDGDFPHLS